MTIIVSFQIKVHFKKKILDLLNEESISGVHSSRVAKSINSTRSLSQVFEKVSRPLKCHSNFWGVIYILYTKCV